MQDAERAANARRAEPRRPAPKPAAVAPEPAPTKTPPLRRPPPAESAAEAPPAPLAEAALPSPPSPPSTAVQPRYRQLSMPLADTDLAALPAEFHALQAVAMKSAAEVRRFAARTGLVGTRTVRVASNGEFFFALLLGIYSDHETAAAAIASLPEEVRALPPWIRPLAHLQAALREPDDGR